MRDQYFTPLPLAEELLRMTSATNVKFVADFASGDGELLRAAARRWPKARLIAADIDAGCVMRLRRNHPDWQVSRCDFLSARSRRSSLINTLVGKASLVLLNPPFTCRGNSRLRCSVKDTSVTCSRALAFVLAALPYLGRRGELAAILPLSSKSSEKDAIAWHHISRYYDVRWTAEMPRRTFQNAVVTTAIVHLCPLETIRPAFTLANDNTLQTRPFDIVRGTVPVHVVPAVPRGRYQFVHTSHLKDGSLVDSGIRKSRKGRLLRGPAVLLPRIGESGSHKCVLYRSQRTLLLSDCVFGIKCKTASEAAAIYRHLVRRWSHVASQYGGACARYLTIAGLRNFLDDFISMRRRRSRNERLPWVKHA